MVVFFNNKYNGSFFSFCFVYDTFVLKMSLVFLEYQNWFPLDREARH